MAKNPAAQAYEQWKKTGKIDTELKAAAKSYLGDIGKVKEKYVTWKTEKVLGFAPNADVLKGINKSWKDGWKYNLWDPEDMQRQTQGAMPKAIEKKYNLDDATDLWLYQNNQPYKSEFSKRYQDAAAKYDEEQAQKVAYNQQYASFQNDLFNRVITAQTQAAPEGRRDIDWETYIADVLGNGRYTDVEANFQIPKDEEDLEGYAALAARRTENKKEANPRAFSESDLEKGYLKALMAGVPAPFPSIARLEQAQRTRPEPEEENIPAILRTKALGAAGNQKLDKAGMEERRTQNRLDVQKAETKQALDAYLPITQAADFARMAQEGRAIKPKSGTLRSVSDYMNGTENSQFWTNAFLSTGGTPSTLSKYSYITPQERDVYFYTLAKQGENAAQEYIDVLEHALDTREMDETVSIAQDLAEKSPVLASIASVPIGQRKGLGYVNLATQTVLGNKVDENDPMFAYGAVQSAIRGTVAEDMSGAGSLLYQTGMSIADFLSLGLGGKAALAIMGTGAGSDTARDALERGATQEQALALGTLAGAAEVIFEKASLDNFIKMTEPGMRAAFLKNALKQSGIEASEEVATEIANKISDALVMGNLSNYNLAVKGYMQQGMTKARAEAKAFGDSVLDIAMAGLGGALSGGVVGSAGQLVGDYRTAQVGRDVRDMGAELRETGLSMPQDTAAYQLAQKGGKETDLWAGRQYLANVDAQQAQARASFEADLQALNVDQMTTQGVLRAYDSLMQGNTRGVEKSLSKLQGSVYQAMGVKAEVDANLNVTRAEVTAKLTPLYTAMQQAAQTGDMMAFQQAQTKYMMEYGVQEAKAQAAKVKAQNQAEAANRTVADTAAEIEAQVAQERAEAQAKANTQAMAQTLKNPVTGPFWDGTINQGGGQDGGETVHNAGRWLGNAQNNSLRQTAYGGGPVRMVPDGGAQGGPVRGEHSEVYAADREGQRISPETGKRLQRTAVRDNQGRLNPVYHFTENMEFTTFAQGDTGFHFGSMEQAHGRAKDKGVSGRYIRAYLDIHNPVNVPVDIMNWHADAVSLKLYTMGLLTHKQQDDIAALGKAQGLAYNSPASVRLREILAAKGYDGIAYANGFEGEGTSYIAFYPEQIIRADKNQGGGSDGGQRVQGVNVSPGDLGGLVQTGKSQTGNQPGDSQSARAHEVEKGSPRGTGRDETGRGELPQRTRPKVNWGRTSTPKGEQSIQNHIETVYRATGMRPNVNITNEVDADTAAILDEVKAFTNVDAFLYESDDDFSYGMADASGAFVRNTGDALEMARQYGHEAAHLSPQIMKYGLKALERIGADQVAVYAAVRNNRISTPDNADVRREMVADAYGSYIFGAITGEEADITKMGLSQDTILTLYNAFEDALGATETETGEIMDEIGNLMGGDTEYSRIGETIQPVMLPYNDRQSQDQLAADVHRDMMAKGQYVEITQYDVDSLGDYFPDLRAIKKDQRRGILSEKQAQLKEDLREILHLMFDGENIELNFNGDIVEARVYERGIQEATKARKISQIGAAMLMRSQEVFDRAEYVYSTEHDLHSGKTRNAEVDRWDYYYVPLVFGELEGGIRIAVMAMNVPEERQIYHWGIKKEVALAGGVLKKLSSSPDGTSATSNNSIPNSRPKSNQNQEYSRMTFKDEYDNKIGYSMPEIKAKGEGYAVDFTVNKIKHHLEGPDKAALENQVREMKQQNAINHLPKAVQHLREARRLFKEGYTMGEYYASGLYDHNVGRLLRRMCVNAGKQMGGALPETEIKANIQDLNRWNNVADLKKSFITPQRMFQNIPAWRDEKTASGRAMNYLAGKHFEETYFHYVMEQGANSNLWMDAKRKKIEAAYGKGDIQTSILAQMLGEGIISERAAGNAISDGKTLVVRDNHGTFIFDRRGQLKAVQSGDQVLLFDDAFYKRMWEANKEIHRIGQVKDKKLTDEMRQATIREIELSTRDIRPREMKGHFTTMESGGNLRVSFGNEVLADIRNGKSPDMQKVNDLKTALTEFYAEVFKEQNKTLVENGQRPIEARANYFPHQSRATTGLQDFVETLRGTKDQLPTEIAGQTGTFKPGKPFTSHLLERMGTQTEFDAIRGFNTYVKSAADLIFYTPAIQRLRQLEGAVRDNSIGSQNREFVSWLQNYTNQLANKKSEFDRGLESLGGRAVYSLSDKLTGLFGAASVAGNISSAMSNMISYLSALPSMDPRFVPIAFKETVLNGFNALKGEYDGFAEQIPFLAQRFMGYEDILTTGSQRFGASINKALGFLFHTVDRMAVEAAARAKYAEHMSKGMTHQEAITRTDGFLTQVFADRSKGMSAALFGAKHLKPFVQFQQEALNQMSHMRDIKRLGTEEQVDTAIRKNGGLENVDWEDVDNHISGMGWKEGTRALLYLLLMSLWGTLTRAFMGRDQTWNPVGMGRDFVRDAKEEGFGKAAGNLGMNALEQLPFSNIFTPLITGEDAGRVPMMGGIEKARDAISTLADQDATDRQKAMAIMQGATSFIPGGAQASKFIRGIEATKRGGAYTASGKLRYPISEDEYWQIVLNGPSAAAPEGYDWQKDTLSPSRTKQYHELVGKGMDKFQAYDFLREADTSSKPAKIVSALAFDQDNDGKSDFDDTALKIVMGALGIELPKGRSVEKHAKREAERYIKGKRKDKDLPPDKLEEAEKQFDYWMTVIGGA